MFSYQQKRDIADAVQKILRDTKHPELPKGEIQFHLHVDGADVSWSWADIKNNGFIKTPGINPHNEAIAADMVKLESINAERTSLGLQPLVPVSKSAREIELEAALRDIASYEGSDSSLDINAANMRATAREALGAVSETKGDENG